MTDPQTTRLERALVTAVDTIARLNQKLAARASQDSEPIAIVGMACRLPGGVTDPESFWQLLHTGRDGVVEVPPDRWDVNEFYSQQAQTPGRMSTRWGGFLQQIDTFDHEFFSISLREAEAMDPQHRLFLETAWEALEDAGCSMASLSGSRTAVYACMSGIEHAAVLGTNTALNSYTGLGAAPSVGAGRLSYLLNLHGPNVVLDSACSSSLVAIHEACALLRRGEADLAVCAAANTILTPQSNISLSQLNESFGSNGQTKTFDAAADGFVRGEGVAVVVLKRTSDAERDRDVIHAMIRGSAVNHDGRSAGLTAPNGAAQEKLLRQAVAASGVPAEQVALVETHGTGTKLGDPIEVQALRKVYGRTEGVPLYLGAVKTNLGHLETAAGLVGVIKTVLSLNHGEIPPNLHFHELNPLIDLGDSSIRIPVELTPWPSGVKRRLAAVSSFGLNGTNAHLILEAPGKDEQAAHGNGGIDQPGRVLMMSAKSPKALTKLARRYQDLLEQPGQELSAVAAVAAQRTVWPHRLAVFGETADEVSEALADFVRGEAGSGCLEVGTAPQTPPALAFLFSGVGSQYPGMGERLYRVAPVFAAVIDQCDEQLQDLAGTSVTQALWSPASESLLADVAVGPAAIFALEMGLAALWRSWGVEPGAVMGHSLGEYAAATYAGVWSLQDGFQLVVERSRLLAEVPPIGAMLAVHAAPEVVSEIVVELDSQAVGIAAINAPQNVTLSGRREAIAEAHNLLQGAGIVCKAIDSPRPGHCAVLDPILDELEGLVGQAAAKPPRIPVVSNLTGGFLDWRTAPTGRHWRDHARYTVQFARGMHTLAEAGFNTFVEIGPGSDALGIGLANFDAGQHIRMLASLRRKRDDWRNLNTSLTRLFVAGVGVDWSGYHGESAHRRVSLPRYPFDPVRFPREPITTTQPTSSASRSNPTEVDQMPDDAMADQVPIWAPPTLRLITAAELLEHPEAEREQAMVTSLSERIQSALGYINASVDPQTPLSNLGLDSLMAVELRNEIQTQLGVEVPASEFLSGATVGSLARHLLVEIDSPAELKTPSSIRAVSRIEEGVLAELLSQVEHLPSATAAPSQSTELS